MEEALKIVTKASANEAWHRSRIRGFATVQDREILTLAYWESALPDDPDYSVAQWVEDGFPDIE